MLEWLLTIGAAELGKVVFEQVLKLGQAAAEEYVTDFFKDCLKEGITSAKPEVTKKAVAEALKAFLILVTDELEDRELSKAEIRNYYDPPLVQFVKNAAVKPILGKAFEKDCTSIEIEALAKIWQQSTLKGKAFPAMPQGFDWQRVGSEYLKKVRRIIRETPELRSLLETELLEKIAQNTTQLSPGFDLAKYRDSLQCNYGYLKLNSLDSTYRVDAIKLWNIFIEQMVREALPPSRYDLPLDLKRQLQQEGQLAPDFSLDILEQYRQNYFQQPLRKVLEAVVDSQWAVILGDPGAGKSTLLQYLALQWVEGKTESLPLLIELREYAIAQMNSFLNFLHHGRGVDWQFDQQQLHQYLQHYPTLVMFDGLDEVFDRSTQSMIVEDIIRFSRQYPKAQVLITSRIIGYNSERLQHANFNHFTIQPLNTDEIHTFIDRWYTLALGNNPDKLRLVTRLKEAITNSKAIENLADNPLLLTMMAILNRQQELPRDRAELYDQASRVLLYHWDVDHKRLQLPMDAIGRREKQEMLRLIAYEMQAGNEGLKGNLISTDQLTRIVTGYLRDQGFSQPREKANLLIQQLRERNFILCYRGADVYGFVHRTFLEYFCAVEIVHRFEKQRTLTFEQLRDEVFGQHWQDETWHEVLRLLSGLIEERIAGQILEELVKQYEQSTNLLSLKLASLCLLEIKNRYQIQDIDENILKLLMFLVEAWGSLPQDTFRENLEEYEQICELIGRCWQYNLTLFEWLQSLINSDSNLSSKFIALRDLGASWKDQLEVSIWIKYLAQNSTDRVIQKAAVLALTDPSSDKDDLELFAILKDLYQQNISPVSQSAIFGIFRTWVDLPETKYILDKCLVHEDPYIPLLSLWENPIAESLSRL
nr:NACHT domain-containing protein [Dendronalium sp. ChiSLP03b]MDZ8209207.1 NACHT domain-containing protein [Dendronalium sp. ChiSLP03b]